MTALFRDVFDDQTIVLRLDTTADDIAGWDSMSQVRLAVEIEHRFAIKIKSLATDRSHETAALETAIIETLGEEALRYARRTRPIVS